MAINGSNQALVKQNIAEGAAGGEFASPSMRTTSLVSTTLGYSWTTRLLAPSRNGTASGKEDAALRQTRLSAMLPKVPGPRNFCRNWRPKMAEKGDLWNEMKVLTRERRKQHKSAQSELSLDAIEWGFRRPCIPSGKTRAAEIPSRSEVERPAERFFWVVKQHDSVQQT
ncbi:hypothetical protein K438DRAFT_1756029 [Mycena galopus ATCC 62051]|nr:hypothetical protein K438DRAFT_1756029 [Mycena galopus ATCC 62051]